MAQVINTNTMSLNAQRNLSTSGSNLATTIQRLSSGLRINSAKDDAAGLAISERFSTQIRGANQAARNANDGISLAQTAEGALGEIGNNLQRMRELAVQSRSATNSASDRQALNSEVQLLKQEIQRVAEQTNFNGTNLLDGTFTNKAFQIGANQGETINISQIANANIDKLGSWTSASRDAKVTGTVPAGSSTPATTPNANAATIDPANFAAPDVGGTDPAYAAFDLTVNGQTVSVAEVAAGTDAEAARASLLTNIATAINGSQELEDAGVSMDGTSGVISNGGAEFTIAATGNALGEDVVVAGATGGSSGKFVASSFTITGSEPGAAAVTIELTKADSAGERATQMVNAVNAKTHETGVSAALVEGKMQLTSKDGNFTIGAPGANPDADALAALTEQTGLTAGVSGDVATDVTYRAGAANQSGFAALDISSIEGADDAILAMDAALNSINSSRADLGAIQNRFTSVVANLNTSSENMSAARSRIRDVDYASETAELTRNQILQQAGTAMLAQANQSSQSVLSLLG